MAVFLINICKYNGCGITFPSLGDLIKHIEYTHIDNDPKIVEQRERAQPACVPLSYVLRFLSDDARNEIPIVPPAGINASTLGGHNGSSGGIAGPATVNASIANSNISTANNNNNNHIISNNNNNGIATPGNDLKRKMAIKHHSYSMSSSNRSNTPTGSEMDEDEMVVTESEDSNESWTTEEFSSEFIMRHSMNGASNGAPGNEKPFACPVPGCKKRYKNVNGIKYHSKNGHKKDGKVRKGYKCHCGKSYKTAQGLKNHALSAHNSMPDNVAAASATAANGVAGGAAHVAGVMSVHHVSGTTTTTNGILMQQRSTSPSQQSLGSLSPSSISNMSSSASSCHGGNSINAASNTHATTANLVLQHLTNGGAGGSGSNSSSSNGATAQHHPQAQQFTINANTNANGTQMHNGIAAALNGTSDTPTYKLHNGRPPPTGALTSRRPSASAASTLAPLTASSNEKLAPTLTRLQSQPHVSATPMTNNANLLNANNNSTVTSAPVPMRNTNQSHGSGSGSGGTVSTTATAATSHQQQRPPATATTNKPSSSLSASDGGAGRPISPRFIEHKCSVNLFKEKFLANLRSNQDNSHKSHSKSTQSKLLKQISEVATADTAKVAPSPIGGSKEAAAALATAAEAAAAAIGHDPNSNGSCNNNENSMPSSRAMPKHLSANFQSAIYANTNN